MVQSLPRPFALLALLMTLVLPMSAAHCVTMALQAPVDRAGAATMRADHSCCAVGGARSEAPSPAPVSGSECACIGLPVAPPAATKHALALVVVALPEPQSSIVLAQPHGHEAAPCDRPQRPPAAPATAAHALRGPPIAA